MIASSTQNPLYFSSLPREDTTPTSNLNTHTLEDTLCQKVWKCFSEALYSPCLSSETMPERTISNSNMQKTPVNTTPAKKNQGSESPVRFRGSSPLYYLESGLYMNYMSR